MCDKGLCAGNAGDVGGELGVAMNLCVFKTVGRATGVGVGILLAAMLAVLCAAGVARAATTPTFDAAHRLGARAHLGRPDRRHGRGRARPRVANGEGALECATIGPLRGQRGDVGGELGVVMNLYVFKTVGRATGVGVGILLATMLAVLCLAGVARAATTPEFYASTIAEGALSGPTWVEAIDVSGDGKLDLVTALSGIDSVSVRLGDGAGGFGAASTYACGGDNPYALDVADLNGDLLPDIAVTNRSSATVTVLQGLGGGVFNLARTISVGTEAIDVKALDLDKDGDLDLAATQMWNAPYTAGKLWLLYNNGSAAFKTVDMPLPFTGSTVMGVGDLNSDGALDVAVGHGYPLGSPGDPVGPPIIPDAPTAGTTESILLNDNLGSHVDGTGWPTTNLVLQPALTVGPYPQGATFADFNGDGNKDICITSRYPNYANIFLGDGTGALSGPTTYSVGPYAKVPVAVDLNKDGAQDIAVCNYGNSNDSNTTISILTGVGNGTFNSQITVTVGDKPHSVAVGDLNGDTWPDLVVPNWKSDDVTVLLNMTNYTSDGTDPVTTISPNDAWRPGPVTVTLTPTDAGSGVAETWYQIGAGSWTKGKSFSVTAEGDTTVGYYSVDRMGNEETHHTAHIKIDNGAPVTTSNADANWHGGAVTVTLSPTDALSGVAQTKYRVDGAASWQTGTSFTISTRRRPHRRVLLDRRGRQDGGHEDSPRQDRHRGSRGHDGGAVRRDHVPAGRRRRLRVDEQRRAFGGRQRGGDDRRRPRRQGRQDRCARHGAAQLLTGGHRRGRQQAHGDCEVHHHTDHHVVDAHDARVHRHVGQEHAPRGHAQRRRQRHPSRRPYGTTRIVVGQGHVDAARRGPAAARHRQVRVHRDADSAHLLPLRLQR